MTSTDLNLSPEELWENLVFQAYQVQRQISEPWTPAKLLLDD